MHDSAFGMLFTKADQIKTAKKPQRNKTHSIHVVNVQKKEKNAQIRQKQN